MPSRSSRRASASRGAARSARIEAHQVEHVRDELRHVAGLRLDRARQSSASASSSVACRVLGQRAARARDRPPVVCASRAISTQAAYCAGLSFRPQRARRLCLRKPRALHRQARVWPANVSSRCRCSGSSTRRRIARQHGEHAETADAHRSAADTAQAPQAACPSRDPRVGRDRPPTAPSTDLRRDRSGPVRLSLG